MPPAGAEGPRTHRFQTCLTMQEVFSQHRGACPGLTYHRVPVPDFCAPREEVRGQADKTASPLAWVLAMATALLRDGELVPQGFRFGSGGLFTALPSLVFACTCVCTCVFIICCRCV